MYQRTVNFVSDIRREFRNMLENEIFKTDKSGCKMLEIRGASFVADEPSIFGKLNSYVDRELEWYKSQSLYVKDIPGKTPPIWDKISDKDGKINSNYGYLVYSDENHNQYMKVLATLDNNINSRQAVMIYQRPTMHEDAYENGKSDFICTNAHQYIWNPQTERLDCVVQMRSNDAHLGFKNDKYWADYVHHDLCTDLNVEPGAMFWQAGTLHIYENDFNLVEGSL